MKILTSYYLWIAVEAVVIAALLFFVIKYSRLKKARTSEMASRKERSLYSQLDEQIINKKGITK